MKAALALFLIQIACVLSTPIDVERSSVDLQFVAERDVRILLITRQNSARQVRFLNRDDIVNSPYNPNRPTRCLVHGFLEDDSADIKVETAAELLRYYDFNVFFFDWSEGSRTINYFAAARRVPSVGQVMANYLDFLHQNSLLTFNRVGVVGFSLGAHIAGISGKLVQRGRIETITGLDPAGPQFSIRDPAGRIAITDANYVECIHTNAPSLLIIGLGLGGPLGHADYYPNGGQSQPGCLINTCSHSRAVEFYVESIANNRFYSGGCDNPNDISERRCTRFPGEWMGGETLNFRKTGRGSFHLITGRRSPFALGHQRST